MGQSGAKRGGKSQRRSSSTTQSRRRTLANGQQAAVKPQHGNGAGQPAAVEVAPSIERVRPSMPLRSPAVPDLAEAASAPAEAFDGQLESRASTDEVDTPAAVGVLEPVEDATPEDTAPPEVDFEEDEADDELVRSSLDSMRRPTRPDLRLTGQVLVKRVASSARGAGDRIRHLTGEQWLWIGVIFLGAVLRYWGMGEKPLHHDESMHAYYSLSFAFDPSSYSYNPLLHGPFQFHAEGIMFALLLFAQHLSGVGGGLLGNPWINDATARIVPATFGVGIVCLPIGLRRELGRAGALITAFLLAVSPSFVYFSRFLREDIYFNFFMFAMLVCAVQFAAKRTTGWFIGIFLASVLAYATFEGFFITAAIFGGFLVMLVAWELANGLAPKLPSALTARERTFFSRALVMLALATVGGTVALIGLHEMSVIGNAISKVDPTGEQPPAGLTQLENVSVGVLLYASIVIALLVITVLIWQLSHESSPMVYAFERGPRSEIIFDDDDDDGSLGAGHGSPDVAPTRRFAARVEDAALAPTRAVLRLRGRLHREEQPFLHLLLSINWVQWFVAFVISWMVFAALFWILPGPSQPGLTLGEGFAKGVGQGLWQGLYYWLDQQHVARGGQPPYYYLLLIPLYEQLAVVFGLAGVVYSLVRPTRFRLFLVWWFVASLGIYSWAGEKMPWLSIQITLPLFLLAGVALNWVAHQCIACVPPMFARLIQRLRSRYQATSAMSPATDEADAMVSGEAARRHGRRRGIAGLAGAVSAFLLLVPMVHSMWVLTRPDAANGPLEMMVYVQTTNDVDLVLSRINHADQVLYGGKHKLTIGVGAGEEWPFYWYLRDFTTTVNWEYNPTQTGAPQDDVLILLPSDAQSFMALHPTGYTAKQYVLRSWFDESYKPLPCTPTKTQPCPASANWGYGVGLGNYLSYGSNPPPNAKFNVRKAAGRLWAWLWTRQPLGYVGGTYYSFTFVVRDGLPIQA
jgi:predicted membrane-bound mannosyltransferase